MEAKERAKQQAINEFLTKCQQTARTFEQVNTTAHSLVLYWQDNNLAEEIGVEDLEPYRFSKEQLEAFIVLLQQVLLLSNGQPITPGNYQRINNLIK